MEAFEAGEFLLREFLDVAGFSQVVGLDDDIHADLLFHGRFARLSRPKTTGSRNIRRSSTKTPDGGVRVPSRAPAPRLYP